jgi:hypothetical protein
MGRPATMSERADKQGVVALDTWQLLSGIFGMQGGAFRNVRE